MPNQSERDRNEKGRNLRSSENSRSAQQHSMHDEEEKTGFPKRV